MNGRITTNETLENFEAGIALDIGTTTICAYLVNLNNGEIIDSASELNNQKAYGADVISRIKVSKNGKTEKLFRAVIGNIEVIISRFKERFNLKTIKKMTVSGNTVMLHLFLNSDISSMGEYPFKPGFIESVNLSGTEIGLDVKNIIVLPSFSAFLGADLIAGFVKLNFSENKNTVLYMDIGTNGEIALYNQGKLYLCSTAAGPAFEGAGIKCGVGGVDGAVNSVKIVNGKIEYATINNKPPAGICGSGFVDAVAVLLKSGVIGKDGAFNEECDQFCERISSKKFYICENVFLTQKDIRQFQLAKSAIKTGVEILLNYSGINIKDIKKIYIAGGMGFFIDKENALLTGIIPYISKQKIEICGNMSLKGALSCLLNDSLVGYCEYIKSIAVKIELANDEAFQKKFIENVNFI